MGNFEFIPLELPGLVLITVKAYPDERGFFVELYKESDFLNAGIRESFVQDNFSRSSRGVLRGLHYQNEPAAQGKLVRCVRGSIHDVAVDIRKGSPTFGAWYGVELSETNHRMLFIPTGFAHGFVVLSEQAEILYKCTREYSPINDRGIIWNDPDIAIHWPVRQPVLSAKDAVHPLLRDADNSFV
jgi:dTDP-4-dehydrorhamnose 3,5-epimerase